MLLSALGAAAGMAVVAVIVGFVFGYALTGLGVAIGLLLGASNAVGMRRMANAIAAAGGAKRPAAMSSLRRLALITAVVFGLVAVKRDLGLGAIVGLGLFQFTLLVSSSRVMLQALRDEGQQ
ncbi:MAG: hypothetical protein FWC87_13580 [Acidimicrobiaceae bacterium]|nr:hypothetical protein [Acidimicrobiaceae bacterium]